MTDHFVTYVKNNSSSTSPGLISSANAFSRTERLGQDQEADHDDDARMSQGRSTVEGQRDVNKLSKVAKQWNFQRTHLTRSLVGGIVVRRSRGNSLCSR